LHELLLLLLLQLLLLLKFAPEVLPAFAIDAFDAFRFSLTVSADEKFNSDEDEDEGVDEELLDEREWLENRCTADRGITIYVLRDYKSSLLCDRNIYAGLLRTLSRQRQIGFDFQILF